MAGSAGTKATLSLGLVTLPVRLQVTADAERPTFNRIHEPCLARVRNKGVCEACGNEVGPEEIAKGFEVDKDTYVAISDEDLEALPVATKRVLQIDATVDPEDIDPVYFTGKTYYVQPEDSAMGAYGILLGALIEEGKAGLGRFAFRESRERMVLLRPTPETLMLDLMFWPDAIRSLDAKEYKVETGAKGQMGMARQLVSNLEVRWDPKEYRDEYREQLLAVVEAKREGVAPVSVPDVVPKAGITDLTAALEASIASIKKKPAAKRTRRKAS